MLTTAVLTQTCSDAKESLNWSLMLVKFLALVVFFTGVFRTTCVSVEEESAEAAEE